MCLCVPLTGIKVAAIKRFRNQRVVSSVAVTQQPSASSLLSDVLYWRQHQPRDRFFSFTAVSNMLPYWINPFTDVNSESIERTAPSVVEVKVFSPMRTKRDSYPRRVTVDDKSLRWSGWDGRYSW